MTTVSQRVTCKECGTQLDESPSTPVEQRKPCPSCGSMARLVHVDIAESLTFHETVGLKARHGTSGRPFLEGKVGDDLYHKTGEWMHLERRIDRDRDEYIERIVDPKTGRVIREAGEPLGEHRELFMVCRLASR